MNINWGYNLVVFDEYTGKLLHKFSSINPNPMNDLFEHIGEGRIVATVIKVTQKFFFQFAINFLTIILL